MQKLMVLALGLGFLSACSNDAPAGQVVATVNGQEITRQQLNTAMRNLNIPVSGNAKDAQNAVLEQLVSKQMVVQAAKHAGLDKSQSFLEAIQGASDSLLISLYVKNVAGASTLPYDGDVSKFIADNPSRFAHREILMVNQIRARTADVDPNWLKTIDTLDQLAAVLKAHNVTYARGDAQLDTQSLDSRIFDHISKMPPGEAFAVKQGDVTLFSTVTGAQPAPLGDLAARDAARDYLRKLAAQQALENRLKALRKDATVRYQNGFAAPHVTSTALAAPAATGDGPP